MTEQTVSPDDAPLNDLETQLALAEQPDANPVDVILAFLNNEVFLISAEAVEGPESSVEPLVLSNAEGQPVLAVFSHPSRVDTRFLEAAPYVLGTMGSAVLGNIGDELGMVINPGSAYGFEIDPEGIANIRRDFKRADEAGQPAE
ncbi:SseB family protein [Arthrobacter sp. CJ23]|uniref:SseB family protein n=1 Tax=Arthrobacter sp. CJ23 TaxID=2972479 RepID=UPI00215BC3A9|nr:SseB family protein [Arthrobacter sp. CJ23]UVJ38828.1 SseB family protein [Arthrobacter sp. CJ23]